MAILKYNGEEIVWTLERRKMKSIRIRIKPDGSVRVSADASVSFEKIESFVNEKAGWIYSHRKNSVSAVSEELKDGVKLHIFDETLTLSIVRSKDENCRRNGDSITVSTENTDDEAKIQVLLCSYLAQITRERIAEYYNMYYPFINYSKDKPLLTLKMLKSKWGHCDYQKNEIMLNFALCGVPAELCEYVVVHELVHLIVPDHSPKFYEAGTGILPDFRARDKRMRKYSTDLMKNITRKSE